MCGKAENNEAESKNNEAEGSAVMTRCDGRWWNDVTEVWWGREVLESVRKTENRGYKMVMDMASTYVLCPRLWKQVSINFRGSEDNEDDGEQSKDV